MRHALPRARPLPPSLRHSVVRRYPESAAGLRHAYGMEDSSAHNHWFPGQ